jgi:ABC-type nickel/cobalt efflux system permease component RcnA
VDVGEFAHNGSTTRKEIAFGGGGKSKDDGPILTVPPPLLCFSFTCPVLILTQHDTRRTHARTHAHAHAHAHDTRTRTRTHTLFR